MVRRLRRFCLLFSLLTLLTPAWSQIDISKVNGLQGKLTKLSNPTGINGLAHALMRGETVVSTRSNPLQSGLFALSGGGYLTNNFYGQTFQLRMYLPNGGFNLRLVFCNHAAQSGHPGEWPNTNDVQVKFTLYDSGGRAYPGYWPNGGSAAGPRYCRIPAGTIGVPSLPVGIYVKPGDYVDVRTCILNDGTTTTGTTGNSIPLGLQERGLMSSGTKEGSSGAVDQCDSGTVGLSGGTGYGPVCILGMTTNGPTSSVAIIGDSEPAGTGDYNDVYHTADSGLGWTIRALGGAGDGSGTIPWLQMSRGGETLANWDYQNANIRMALAGYCTDAVCELGINDDYAVGGSVVTTVEANGQAAMIRLWERLDMMHVWAYQTTLLPVCANTTDQFETVANTIQGSPTAGSLSAANSNIVRAFWNDWIRAGAPVTGTKGNYVAAAVGANGSFPCPYLHGFFELADIAETARNSGIWKCPNAAADSGTSSGAGTTTTIVDSSKTWTVNQWAGYMVRITGGTGLVSASTAGRIILSNTATTLTVSAVWAGTTPDNTTTYHIYQSYTLDGTHPSPYGHNLLKAAMPASTFVLHN